jgi:hypothetical protein
MESTRTKGEGSWGQNSERPEYTHALKAANV